MGWGWLAQTTTHGGRTEIRIQGLGPATPYWGVGSRGATGRGGALGPGGGLHHEHGAHGGADPRGRRPLAPEHPRAGRRPDRCVGGWVWDWGGVTASIYIISCSSIALLLEVFFWLV